MTSLEVVYEEADEIFIKEELDPDDLQVAHRGSNALSIKQVIFEKDDAKCGEVLLGNQGNFMFVCALCMMRFNDLQSFGIHLRSQHLVDELGQETSKPETQPYTLKVSKPKDNPHLSAIDGSSRNCVDNQPSIVHTLIERCPEINGSLKDESALSDDPDDIEQKNRSNNVSSEDECIPDECIPEECKTNGSSVSKTKDEQFCVLCGRIYKTKRSYLAHLEKEHGNVIEVLKTSSKGDVDSIVVPTPSTMTCKYCDQSFEDSASFKLHVVTHTGSRRFVCPHCQKTFASRYNRQAHINTHTGERPFKCTHCPKGFSDATNLEMHIRMHLRIMKYACTHCDKRFVQSTEKKLHERTHTGERPFQCEECGKCFISHVKLTEHDRRHKNIKNYKCEFCAKTFYSSSLLKDHMPVHTRERPFHCNICAQSFPRRKSLRAHEQLHSSEKKYICDKCGKAFAQCAGLYSHRKSHGEAPK